MFVAGEIQYPSSGTSSTSELVSQEAHGFVHGMPVYFDKGVNYWRKASADVTAEQYDTFSFCVVSDFVSINSFRVESVADITPADWSLITQSGVTIANGDALYLSQSEQGRYTNVQPTTGFEQQLGVYENGCLHFHPQAPVDLNAISTDITRVVDNTDYYLESVVRGTAIDIYVRLKENTTGAKTLNIDLIQLGVYAQFCLLRYVQAIESRNYAITGSGAYNGPVLSFNKLLNEAIPETFGVSGVGGNIGGHMILDNSSYFSNRSAGSAYPSYFGSQLLPQVSVQALTMQVVYSNNCIAQIGLNFKGQIFPL